MAEIDYKKFALPKSKKRKKLTIPKLRGKAFKYFSLYIRLENAVDGYVRCVTCGKYIEAVGECEAGHFEHGLNKEFYFDERNVHPQCTRCNMFLNGNMRRYTLYMLKRYGQETVNQLMNSKTVIWKREALEDIVETYKKKLKKLEGE